MTALALHHTYRLPSVLTRDGKEAAFIERSRLHIVDVTTSKPDDVPFPDLELAGAAGVFGTRISAWLRQGNVNEYKPRGLLLDRANAKQAPDVYGSPLLWVDGPQFCAGNSDRIDVWSGDTLRVS